MATRRRKKAEVLTVSISESDDDAPPPPGPSRHRRTLNNQLKAKKQRPERRIEVRYVAHELAGAPRPSPALTIPSSAD